MCFFSLQNNLVDTDKKLQRIKKAFLYLEEKHTYCSLQSQVFHLRSKRLLSRLQDAESLQEWLYILPAIEVFMKIGTPKRKRKIYGEYYIFIVPLLRDSESGNSQTKHSNLGTYTAKKYSVFTADGRR